MPKHSSAQDKDMEENIKDWLKNAKQRLDRAQKQADSLLTAEISTDAQSGSLNL